jgi:hypothetical protein
MQKQPLFHVCIKGIILFLSNYALFTFLMYGILPWTFGGMAGFIC